MQAIADQGFPVFARFHTPIDIVCAWRAEAFGEPIAIGGLQVLPDDHVLADRDGIVLIGAAEVEAVLAAAERKLATEVCMLAGPCVRGRGPVAELPALSGVLAAKKKKFFFFF